jgi:hypothetical protein
MGSEFPDGFAGDEGADGAAVEGGVFHETAELALEKPNAAVIRRGWIFRF